MYENQNNKKYIDKLLEQTEVQKNSKKVKLQLNMDVTEQELKSLKKLVEKLKRNGQKSTIKSVVYGALKESGIFDIK
jgi:ribosomal protein S7